MWCSNSMCLVYHVSCIINTIVFSSSHTSFTILFIFTAIGSDVSVGRKGAKEKSKKNNKNKYPKFRRDDCSIER